MGKMDPEEVRKRLMREAAEEALAEAADNDAAVAKWLDDDFEKGFGDIIGMSTGKLRDQLDKAVPGISEQEVREAQRAIAEAKRALDGGWLSKPNPKEAERILMGVRGIRELKKSKSEKSCFIAALLLLTGSGATVCGLIYGATEVVSALVR